MRSKSCHEVGGWWKLNIPCFFFFYFGPQNATITTKIVVIFLGSGISTTHCKNSTQKTDDINQKQESTKYSETWAFERFISWGFLYWEKWNNILNIFSCTSEYICFTIKLSPSKRPETCQTQFRTYLGKCKSQYKETYTIRWCSSFRQS